MTIKKASFCSYPKQSGFILAYVMLAVALLTLTMAALSYMNRGMASKTYMDKTKTKVAGQMDTIRSRILLCALTHPNGDNGTTFNISFPGGTAKPLKDLTCPGAPGPNQSIWTGSGGTFLPTPVSGFGSGWLYTNDATGVRLILQSQGGALDNNVLTTIAEKYTTSEATYAAGVLTLWIKTS